MSVVTAILVEPAGTFVPDGTVVFFFTNLGRVDASGKTVNGVARVNFVSDSRSGTATVVGVSGGPAAAPSASPTASPAAGTGVGVTASDARTPVGALDVSATTGENTAYVDISIGSALPARVVGDGEPAGTRRPRASAAITANVFDEIGNPVQNVPVIFQVAAVGTGAAAGGPLERRRAAVHRLERPGLRHPHDEGGERDHAEDGDGDRHDRERPGRGHVDVAVNYTAGR